jgi:hypothetical protein
MTPVHALLVPEICSAIFEQLALDGCIATLAAAARVCRVWFAPAARELWRAPPVRAFALATRLQQNGNGGCEARCRHVYGPAVRMIEASFDAAFTQHGATDRTDDVWRFPNVRAVQCPGTDATSRAGTLADILARCGPLLMRVEVGWLNGWLACQSLDRMSGEDEDEDEDGDGVSGGGSGSSIDATTAHIRGPYDGCQAHCIHYSELAVLALRGGLHTVVAHNHMPRYALERCLRDVVRRNAAVAGAGTGGEAAVGLPHPPFRHLRALAVHMCGAEVPALVALLVAAPAPLAALDLHVIHAAQRRPRFLVSLTRLRRLRELRIEWCEWPRVDGAQFARLGGLAPELRVLRLDDDPCLVNDDVEGAEPAPADEHLLAVVSRLPHLAELALSVEGRFTGNALRMVGEHCRRLASLDVDLPCDVTALERSPVSPLFPLLESLYVSSFVEEDKARGR